MNIDKKYSILVAIVVLVIILIFAFLKSNLIWHSNINKYIEKAHKQSMSIKRDEDFSYKGRKYRIIVSTPSDKKDELYLQCFEEVLNGNFYKTTYGAEQGDSKSLYGMVKNYINDGTNDSFIIVYGYNKGFKSNKFNFRPTNNSKQITQNILKEEYFLYTYPNMEYPLVEFKDINNKDITKMFIGQ